MENLFDNYELRVAEKNDVGSLISTYNNTSSTKTTTNQKLENLAIDAEGTQPARSVLPAMLGVGTVLLATFIWIVCTVSLVLNIIRKNVGKAVFSGVAYIIPLIDIGLVTIGSAFEIVPLMLVAFIIQIITFIIVFIFCFSKNKNAVNQQNNVQ